MPKSCWLVQLTNTQQPTTAPCPEPETIHNLRTYILVSILISSEPSFQSLRLTLYTLLVYHAHYVYFQSHAPSHCNASILWSLRRRRSRYSPQNPFFCTAVQTDPMYRSKIECIAKQTEQKEALGKPCIGQHYFYLRHCSNLIQTNYDSGILGFRLIGFCALSIDESNKGTLSSYVRRAKSANLYF